MSKIKCNKLFVVGSKSIIDKKWILSVLEQYSFDILIVGLDSVKYKSHKKEGLLHADDYVYEYAQKKKIKIISIIPDWQKPLNRSCSIKIAQLLEILDTSNDKGIVLWDGKSKDCWNIIDILRKAKKLHSIHNYHVKTLTEFIPKIKE